MMDDRGEPVEPVTVESFCVALRDLIVQLRAAPPEEIDPNFANAAIESFERALRALELPSDQETP